MGFIAKYRIHACVFLFVCKFDDIVCFFYKSFQVKHHYVKLDISVKLIPQVTTIICNDIVFAGIIDINLVCFNKLQSNLTSK